MEVDIQQLLGFVSLLGGFFITLGKLLQLISEAQRRLLSMLEQLNGRGLPNGGLSDKH